MKGHKEDCNCLPCKAKRGETKGENNPFYGKNHSDITRQNMKNNKKGTTPKCASWNKGLSKESDERVQKVAKGNKAFWDSLSEEERKSTEEHKKNISISLKGKKKSESHKKNMSKSRKGKKNPKISEINKETWANPEIRQKRIEGIKRAWAEPNKKQSWISAANKANSFHKINKVETKLKEILDSLFPNEYKYTGDASIIIEGKIPDFININGQKKIIELFGNYWHGEGDVKIRKEYFNKYGYETLIIWEDEMKNLENVKNKLIEFNMKGGGV